MKEVIKTNQLTKAFKRTRVVDNVSMTVNEGEIYGLVGKNGAGKSTLLKMIAGLYNPTSGDLEIFGGSDESLNNQRIGVLIEEPGLYDHLTAYENLEIMAAFIGIQDKSRIDDVLNELDIADTGKKKVAKFSMGMKQRLGIAMALLSNPDLLILDEPINGLDPQGIKEIRDILLKLNKQGKTIIISSHILGELTKVATSYGVIHEGMMVKEISSEDLVKMSEDYYLIQVDDMDKASFLIEEHFDNRFIVREEGITLLEYDNASEIVTKLAKEDVVIYSSQQHTVDVEDYLLALMDGDLNA